MSSSINFESTDTEFLPVYQYRKSILKTLEENSVVVIESPTGSGKTTQLPRILHQAGYGEKGVIGVTQPRRIAAVSVSEFISQQLNVGNLTTEQTIGYKVRFNDTTSETTEIKIMTDGILLQELKHDQILSKYSVLIIDEAHERSLNIDFILGLLKKILQIRSAFKLVISSATINTNTFSHYFNNCPIVKIKTHSHPVEVIYRPFIPENDPQKLIAAITKILININKSDTSGDVLIFLSGERDIRECLKSLSNTPENTNWILLPLFGRLSKSEQLRVFEIYKNYRKIIVATNIAETSITIPGIKYVIDSGKAKINSYNTKSFTASLTEQAISISSCNQRKGRAGRTEPGTCYRLFSKQSLSERPVFPVEEIHRTDLSEVVLRMAELGISDFEKFDFLSPPSKERLLDAIKLLQSFDALDSNRNLTSIGKIMIKFPIEPRHSRMIVEAINKYPNVLEETLIGTAFLSAPSPFIFPEGQEFEARKAHENFNNISGDFAVFLDIFTQFSQSDNPESYCEENFFEVRTLYEIVKIKEQLQEVVGAIDIPILKGGPMSDYLCSLASGLPQSICISIGPNRYRSATAKNIFIHPGSCLYENNVKYFVAGEIIRTTRLYARSISPLKKEEVRRISPGLFKYFETTAIQGNHKEHIKKKQKLNANPEGKIKILGAFFSFSEKNKRKDIVNLPWEKISILVYKNRKKLLKNYSNIRGQLILDNKTIMAGAKLSALFEVIRKINPDHQITSQLHFRVMTLPADSSILIKHLSLLLGLHLKKPSGNKFFFLSLQNNQKGSFWLSSRRNYKDAVEDCLESLSWINSFSKVNLSKQFRAKIRASYLHIEYLR